MIFFSPMPAFVSWTIPACLNSGNVIHRGARVQRLISVATVVLLLLFIKQVRQITSINIKLKVLTRDLQETV